MFEKFTQSNIKVIMLAQEEARRLGHNFVGSEQILLGLIGEKRGVGGAALISMGVTHKQARIEVEKIIGRGSGFVEVEIPFTPRAKRILELSWKAAKDLNHKYIGTEHMLLGLIAESEFGSTPGVACQALKAMNVNLKKLKERVLSKIEEGPAAAEAVETEPMRPSVDVQFCPNCAEQIKPDAIMCRHCYAGISEEHYQPCPFCAEMVRKQAKLCRYCQSNLTTS